MPFNIQNTSNTGDAGLLELDDAFTVTTAEVGGTTFVFATGLRDDGISVFSADPDGVLTNVDNVTDDATLELSGAYGLTTVEVAGVTYLIASGFEDNGLSVFSVGNDGLLTNVYNLAPPNVNVVVGPNQVLSQVVIFGPGELATAVVAGATYLFVPEYLGNQINVYSVAAGGILTAVTTVGDNLTRELQGAISVTTAVVAGTTYLFVGGQTDDGITVFSVAADGSLSDVDSVSDDATLELDGVRAVATAEVDGNTFLFAAGLADDGISVFSVAANGTLSPVGNVRDGGLLELDGAAALRVMTIGSTSYLFVGGSEDDGISVFSIAADGSLTNLTNVTDNTTLRLDRVQSLAVAEIGGRSFLFAAGQNDDGLSTFLINPPVEIGLAPPSDSGLAGDLLTNDATPTITYQVESLATVQIDWGDGAGFQLSPNGTGTPQQVTRPTPYETDGPKTIRIEATGTLGNVQTGEVVINIDRAGPLFDEGALAHVDHVTDTAALELSMVGGVATATVSGVNYLFAAGSADAGVSVFQVAGDGTLGNTANLQDTGALALGGAGPVATAVVDGTTYLIVAGTQESGISVFAVNPNGSLTATDTVFDQSGLNLAGVANIATVNDGATTFLFAAAPAENGITAFRVNPGGTLTAVDTIADTPGIDLAGVRGLAAAVVDGKALLFAGGIDEAGITVFQAGSDGALTEIGRIGDTALMRIDGVSALATATIAGSVYLFASGADDGGISMFSVGADGSLSNLANLADTPSTYLGAIDALSTANIAGATYLFAASATENGVSAFVVSPEGGLVNVANIADTGMRQLGGVAGLTTAVMDDAAFLIAAGRTDSGLSVFSVGPALALDAASDTGVAGDNITRDRMPDLTYQVEAGADVQVDWDDGRGFVAVADGTGAVQQITPDMPYDSDGARTVTLVATDAAGNTATRTLNFEIDTLPPVFGGFALNNTDNVSDTATFNLFGVRGLETVTAGGNTFVLSAGYRDDGISVFALDRDGGLSNVANVSDTAGLELLGVTSFGSVVFNDVTYVIAAGTADDGISVFALTEDGIPINVDNVADTAALELDAAYDIATATIGEQAFVFVSGFNDDGLSAFMLADGGKLTETDTVRDNATLHLNGASGFATARVGDFTYLFAAGYVDDGISVFAVGEDGSLTNVENIADTGELNLNQVISLATAQVGDTSYLFSASDFDNGISVFEIDPDGSLSNVANVNDDLTLRLAGALSITTAEQNGVTYLMVAGSADNGVSVFEVSEDGTLTNLANLADDATLLLNRARGVTTAEVDGTTFMLVAGQVDNGISVFALEPGIELVAASDTGVVGDNVTSDTTPTIAYTAEAGATVRIDWGDGRGFVPVADGTGSQQQITAALPSLIGGPRTIVVEASDVAGNTNIRSLPITIGIEPQVAAPALMAQTGQTALTHNAVTITLDRSFENPVVFAKTTSVNGPAPVTVRFDDIGADRFTMWLQEPNNEDGIHAAENVAWAVFEAGAWELPDGTRFEVGTVQSNLLSGAGFEPVAFRQGLFSESPVIQSQVQTLNGSDYVVTRQQAATADGFRITMQEEEALNGGAHATETLGWIAMEAGRGLWDGRLFEAGQTGDRVTDAFAAQAYVAGFQDDPVLLTSLSRFDGADPGAARARATPDGFEVRVQEDTSADSEVSHTAEAVDFLAISGAGLLAARQARPVIAEYGSMQMNHDPVDVRFDNRFVNPVVFAKTTTENGPAPVTVRVDAITATGFTAMLQEPGNEDGLHAVESVSWMVVEAGTWELGDGTVLEAGTLDSARLSSAGFETVRFGSQSFDTTPTVISQVQTLNGSDFVFTRQQNGTSDGFRITMQEEEALNGGAHATETLGWLAVTRGAGRAEDDLFEAGVTPDAVTDAAFVQTFSGPLTAPVLLSQLSRFDGADPTQARVGALGNTGFSVRAQEDTSADAETGHSTETVDYLALSGDGVLHGQAFRPVIGEAGQASLTDATLTVTLQHAFDNPVVFALIPSQNGPAPVAVRITDVRSDAFAMRLQEPANEDGAHTAEAVSWLVLEAGSWQLADGTTLEVGTLDSDNLVPTQGFESVAFSRNFDETPAIFSQVQSDAGADWVVTRQTNATPSGFGLGMQEEQAFNAGTHATETLGWFAISRGTGFWDGHAYEVAGTGDRIDDDFDSFAFTTDFAEAPRLLASLASFDGPDPAALRHRSLTADSVALRVMEETSADAETDHTDESVDIFALEGTGLLTASEWM